MIQRCTNPKHLAYAYYGGRGIKVCDWWREYDAFEIDMGEAPPGMWLDRIDNTKGYEPGNCRWVTPKESARNRKKRVSNNPNSLMQKAKRAGLPYHVVYARIVQWRWPEDVALRTPVLKRGEKPPEERWARRQDARDFDLGDLLLGLGKTR